MIAYLKGIILQKKPPFVLLEVQGVGYELQVPMGTFYSLADKGGTCELHTHLLHKEEGPYLFGFLTEKERMLFRLLIKISGIGPKLALVILSKMTVDEFVFCIEHKNIHQLVSLPGVGKKTAERLLLEIGDRLQDWSMSEQEGKQSYTAKQDALSALLSLGFKAKQVEIVLKQVYQQDISSEALIKEALQELT